MLFVLLSLFLVAAIFGKRDADGGPTPFTVDQLHLVNIEMDYHRGRYLGSVSVVLYDYFDELSNLTNYRVQGNGAWCGFRMNNQTSRPGVWATSSDHLRYFAYYMEFLYSKFAMMKSVVPTILALLIVSPGYPDQPAFRVLAANPRNTLTAMRSPNSSAILIAAHRGGYANDKEGRAPENSLENIVNCQRKGYDLYETDIQRTSDGHFVIVHDSTIDRETTGTGAISETSLRELKRHRKRYRDGSVSESRVATLGELLDAGLGRTIFKADLKPGVSEHFDDVLEIAENKNALDAIVFRVQYRDLPAFLRHRKNGLAWSRGLVMFRVKAQDQLDKLVDSLNPTIIQIDVSKKDPTNSQTMSLIKYARSLGIYVEVHAEGDPADWRRLYLAGARMFHTTNPRAVAEFRESFHP